MSVEFKKKDRTGFALYVVLLGCFLITAAATVAWRTVHDDLQIATNSRRILGAKLAADSGIAHFQALNIFHDDLERMAVLEDAEEFVVIQETPLSGRTSYQVEVSLCCDLGENEFIVKSIGYYKKAGNVISTQVRTSLFKTLPVAD